MSVALMKHTKKQIIFEVLCPVNREGHGYHGTEKGGNPINPTRTQKLNYTTVRHCQITLWYLVRVK